MKVLSYFAPENHWFSWGSNSFEESSCDTCPCEEYSSDDWQSCYEEPLCTARPDREIPIQLIGHKFNPEGSYNMNNSSELPRRPLRRTRPLQTHQSPQRRDVIDLVKEEEPTRHVTRSKPHKLMKLSPDPRNVQFSSTSKPVDNDGDITCNDSDEENDINKTSSYEVYDYLKALLQSTDRQIDSIRGDGNCFFRALSKIIYGNQTFYNEVRQAVVDLIEKYSNKFDAFIDQPMSAHIKDMREDKTWATQTEIYSAATLLNKDIYVLSPDQSGETYKWLLFSPRFKYKSDLLNCNCYITLCHTHGNHYDRIAPIDRRRKCNCHLQPPELSGTTDSVPVDLTSEDEIV